jgi:enoyl-CoA hydratase/carnithine racemase
MTYENIIYEKKDQIGRITLNRPEKMNALSHDLLAELDMVLEDINQDIDVSVVIIKGAGRTFSATN